MHELGLMQNIVDTVLEYARKNSVRKVSKIVVEVGEMSGVVPEALEFCFDVCIKDTALVGAEFEIVRVSAVGKCRACGETFPLLENSFSCPTCNRAEWDLLSGRDLVIKGLEVI
ncbi:MAG: hydrogenase maturation nickel metallochaperone HypA [Deltaproteobacteria bacterium]|nr:hydrogenase maturation nickel metallochaperone HypA [Deltaproteobacteria bacterium]